MSATTSTTSAGQAAHAARSGSPLSKNQQSDDRRRESVERELLGLVTDLAQAMTGQEARIARLEGRISQAERRLDARALIPGPPIHGGPHE
jgi:TolA-binding protein